MTERFLTDGYIASYNMPFNEKIYEKIGIQGGNYSIIIQVTMRLIQGLLSIRSTCLIWLTKRVWRLICWRTRIWIGGWDWLPGMILRRETKDRSDWLILKSTRQIPWSKTSYGLILGQLGAQLKMINFLLSVGLTSKITRIREWQRFGTLLSRSSPLTMKKLGDKSWF